MNYPGDTADPLDVARWMAQVAETEYNLPGILPVMTSCVELTQAWTGPGDVKDVPGYLYSQDYDSLGYFQQRPSQGWGAPEELIDADYALRAFLRAAKAIEDDSPADTAAQLGAWCQAVQRSAYPERYADLGYPMAMELLKEEKSNVSVKASDIVEAARSILGASYVWWELGDPLPKWYYQYPNGAPPSSWVFANGIHCSDFISYARQLCGLPAIGGTGDYQDWLEANGGVEFDPSTAGVPGALCVHRYEGPYGSAQGHIAMYTDEHTLIQATSMYGVNEGEQDYDSHGWANYYVYGLMPDVSYDGQPATETSPAKDTDSGVGGTWRVYGWYEFESPTSYKLIHHPGEGQ